MAASYTATAKHAMCGVSASLNSRSATAAFHLPHTTPSPASQKHHTHHRIIKRTISMKSSRDLQSLTSWCWNEASDKIRTAVPTMTQISSRIEKLMAWNMNDCGLHLSFTTTEQTKSYQGFRINRGVATSTDTGLLESSRLHLRDDALLVCGTGTAGHLGHSYCCYFACPSLSADLYSAHM